MPDKSSFLPNLVVMYLRFSMYVPTYVLCSLGSLPIYVATAYKVLQKFLGGSPHFSYLHERKDFSLFILYITLVSLIIHSFFIDFNLTCPRICFYVLSLQVNCLSKILF